MDQEYLKEIIKTKLGVIHINKQLRKKFFITVSITGAIIMLITLFIDIVVFIFLLFFYIFLMFGFIMFISLSNVSDEEFTAISINIDKGKYKIEEQEILKRHISHSGGRGPTGIQYTLKNDICITDLYSSKSKIYEKGEILRYIEVRDTCTLRRFVI